MKLDSAQGNITEQPVDCLIVNLFDGVKIPAGATGAVDKALDGAISAVVASGDFSGKAGTSALLYTNGKLPAARVLVVGLGTSENFDLHGVRKAGAVAAKALGKLKGVKSAATIVHGAGIGGLDVEDATAATVEGSLLASYHAPSYRREKAQEGLESLTVVEYNGSKLNAIRKGIASGVALAEAICTARDLSNEPPNILYPEEMAARAKAMAERTGLSCTILGEAEMEKLGMGILLAVSKGSRREAQLVILEHAPQGHSDEAPLILVGKGITFDTGGISIKPGDRMEEMKHDMSGAAAVIGAMEAIARLNLPRRVMGVSACVENMPDGNAFRPGDILTGITGKTTEILSTDAEGRLVLADALGYVTRFNPKAVVDAATLTGAIGVALGPYAAGLFVNNDSLKDALLAAAKASGERLWQMPLYDEYMDAIKGDMAEVKNSGGRGGGVGTSAKFIEHFTEGYPWAHLDIANVAWTGSEKDPLNAKGATGYGVRLFVELAKGF